jgi:hypothetical protein
MYQRLVSLKMSWDVAVLGKVMMNKGRWTVVVPSVGDHGWLTFVSH